MATDGMFDESGGYQSNRHPSREITPEEIQELERRARKEGKRDIILSQLVDQQAETAQTLREVQIRIAQGDRDIERLNEEHSAAFNSIKSIADQADKTTELVTVRMTQYDERLDSLSRQVEDSIKEGKPNIVNSVITNVVSAVVIAAVMGGLAAWVMVKNS